MSDKIAQFRKFSDTRLIDIVKQAKQFGYDDETRNAALLVLKERGISEQDLHMTGNLSNPEYDRARDYYKAYIANSRVAFVAYCTMIILRALDLFRIIDTSGYPGLYLGLLLAAFIFYFIPLVRSFLDHMNFYKAIGKKLGTGDQIIFFVLGMPLYFFMYFFYKRQMKEEMQMLN